MRAAAFFDLDGLRIPASEGVRLLPVVDGKSGTVVAVTTVRGRTAIQLQAFHVSAGRPWDSVRLELLARIRRDGGTAEEVIGPSGPSSASLGSWSGSAGFQGAAAGGAGAGPAPQ
ncbi:DUF3710 domain-containing protein [Streptomyces sp. NPDC055056]